MLPPKIQLPPAQQQLLKLFRQLPETEQDSLLSYAEFLLQRGAGEGAAPDERLLPEEIPRPESESVVAAMRRLSKTYFMLDKDHLLHEASDLMTAHLMQGRPAAEVIDELEAVFQRHYDRMQPPPDQANS